MPHDLTGLGRDSQRTLAYYQPDGAAMRTYTGGAMQSYTSDSVPVGHSDDAADLPELAEEDVLSIVCASTDSDTSSDYGDAPSQLPEGLAGLPDEELGQQLSYLHRQARRNWRRWNNNKPIRRVSGVTRFLKRRE